MTKSYKHVNVLQLYDMFATVKRVYLVLELASAGDLLSHINRCCAKNSGQSVPEESARSLFKGVASGLRFIHKRGIAHRDLKCENILLTNDLVIKLCDFGFAIDTNDSVELLKTHCGSYAYASPEILRQQRYDGKMADLWSLGVVLFAMVNGGLPFKESDAKAVLEAMKKPVYFRTSLSSECKDLIRGLLRIKPQRRYTIDEVINHPWITQLKQPENSIVVKVPHVGEMNAATNQTKHFSKIPNQELMSDPAAVSNYINNQMRPKKVERSCKSLGWRGYGGGKRVDKESSTNTPESPKQAFSPKKTEINYQFKATIDNLQSQMNDTLLRNNMGLLGQKQSRKMKSRCGDKIAKDCVTQHHVEGNQPVKLQSIYDICRNNVAISTKSNKKDEAPTPIKNLQKREMASPNVVNIRIDQVVDLISSNSASERPNTRRPKETSTSRSGSRKGNWKKDSSLRKQQSNKLAKVNIVHLTTGTVEVKGSTPTGPRKHQTKSKTKYSKAQHDGTGFPRKLRQTTAWDAHPKSLHIDEKHHGENRYAARAFTTPYKTRNTPSDKHQASTNLKSKTSSLLPSKESGRQSRSKRIKSSSTNVKVIDERQYQTIFKDQSPQSLPHAKEVLQEAGELHCNNKNRNSSKSCGGSPTNMSRPRRPAENPADAWELKPKAKAEEHMDVNQLLKYQIRQDRHDTTFMHNGRHSHQSIRYGCLASAEDPRSQHFPGMSAEGLRTHNDVSKADFTVFSPPGHKILYRRAQQPKQTMQTIQQLKKQARYAARSRKHFLPLPSCGVGRNSPSRIKDALAIPVERLYNSQTVVLRLNKT